MKLLNNRLFGVEVDMKNIHNPYELYRKMRPYYFSDSHVEKKMTPELFAYTMNKLSTDMKQDMFVELTRQIVERIVTPNLIPQTGPTGGGDGGTDIETHAVSDEIAERWFVPGGGCHNEEKWAFAVSCKKEWKSKIDSDVKKIVDTKRGFTKIHFCTNQNVSDQDKVKLEKKYKNLYNVEIVIFDFNWYKQAVFEQGCYNITIKALNLSKELEEIIIQGPNDKARELELSEIDERTAKVHVCCGINTDYIEDLLRAAILTRELERPVNEIDGRFAVALAQAQKHGLSQQIFNVIYQIGWTEFYWKKNPQGTFEQYQLLIDMLNQEINVARIEKAYTLKNLIYTAITAGLLKSPPEKENYNEYWKLLYDKISKDDKYCSSSLYLKLILLETKLFSMLKNTDANINTVLSEIQMLMEEASRHLDIPFEINVTILNEIGNFITNNEVFEQLIDKLTEILASRKSDIAAADVQYDRGVQNLNHGNYQFAIKHLGQCIVAYQKEPTRDNLIQACMMLASAYNNLDILNSAKIFYVKALSLLFYQSNLEGELNHLMITIMEEICYIDIRLGQMNDFFNWLNIMDKIVSVNPLFYDEQYRENRYFLDASIAIQLLSLNNIAKEYEVLPSILEEKGLPVSHDVMLYKLGYLEEISKEFKEIIMSDSDWESEMLNNTKENSFLFGMTLATKENTIISTVVGGCRISASFRSNFTILAYAEQLLACIESFMSTMKLKDIAVITPSIHLIFKVSSKGKTEMKNDGRNNEYKVKINLCNTNNSTIWKLCTAFLYSFLSKNAMCQDFNVLFDEKEKEEKIGERLAVMSSYDQELNNCLIYGYKKEISDWISPESKRYISRIENRTTNQPTQSNKGAQANRIITGLIDYPLWDQAKWYGCGYMFTYDMSEPAIMIFLYKDIKSGKKIFEQWEEEYHKKNFNIQIVVISGIDNDHPQWYKVLVTPDMKKILQKKDTQNRQYIVAASRFHLMQANNYSNIKQLKDFYTKFHFIGISAAQIENDQMTSDRQKMYERVIPVTNVVFKDAWTIGENEPESVAILAKDNPVIPEEHKNDAPVIKILENKKKYQNEK